MKLQRIQLINNSNLIHNPKLQIQRETSHLYIIHEGINRILGSTLLQISGNSSIQINVHINFLIADDNILEIEIHILDFNETKSKNSDGNFWEVISILVGIATVGETNACGGSQVIT